MQVVLMGNSELLLIIMVIKKGHMDDIQASDILNTLRLPKCTFCPLPQSAEPGWKLTKWDKQVPISGRTRAWLISSR